MVGQLDFRDMKVIDSEILYQGKVSESVLVHSFEEYKKLGGTRDMLDLYALVKDRAKCSEGNYISYMDQALSGIPVSDEFIERQRLKAQVNWYLLHLWFNKPLRKVSYGNFDLDEFNRL